MEPVAYRSELAAIDSKDPAEISEKHQRYLVSPLSSKILTEPYKLPSGHWVNKSERDRLLGQSDPFDFDQPVTRQTSRKASQAMNQYMENVARTYVDDYRLNHGPRTAAPLQSAMKAPSSEKTERSVSIAPDGDPVGSAKERCEETVKQLLHSRVPDEVPSPSSPVVRSPAGLRRRHRPLREVVSAKGESKHVVISTNGLKEISREAFMEGWRSGQEHPPVDNDVTDDSEERLEESSQAPAVQEFNPLQPPPDDDVGSISSDEEAIPESGISQETLDSFVEHEWGHESTGFSVPVRKIYSLIKSLPFPRFPRRASESVESRPRNDSSPEQPPLTDQNVLQDVKNHQEIFEGLLSPLPNLDPSLAPGSSESQTAENRSVEPPPLHNQNTPSVPPVSGSRVDSNAQQSEGNLVGAPRSIFDELL